jgi:HAD superfamily hydrolase (TIGR01509 family)
VNDRRAVLFDLDGVVIDTRSATSEALRTLASAALGLAVEADAVEQCVALAPVDALTALGVPDARQLYEQRFDGALSAAIGRLRVFQPVVAGMAALAEHGVGLGIITAQARQRLSFLLPPTVARLVNVVIAHEDAAPKPAPDGVLFALDQLGVQAADAMFIGDMANDVAAGHAAGVLTVGAGWGFVGPSALHSAGADLVLTQPHQVGASLLPHLDGRPGPVRD